jgi:hypothetical protein
MGPRPGIRNAAVERGPDTVKYAVGPIPQVVLAGPWYTPRPWLPGHAA